MRTSTHPLVSWLLGLAALAIAAVSARPYAGSWNDGSRLAAVESLGDRHTFAIDESIFCRPAESGRPPYTPSDAGLRRHGTLDKLRIGEHYYSDKPPVISVLMAGLYQATRAVGLPRAAERPDLFCWTMTFLTSGLAYVLAVLALHRLGRLLDLPDGLHFAWLASFAFSTVALAYTRHVNNHILLLGAAVLVCLQLAHLERGGLAWWRLLLLGALGGLAFNLDFGCGTMLLAVLFLLSIRWGNAAGWFLLGAAPWLAAGLALNQGIGGVWKPLNMVPEFFEWPGSPFSPENMTGVSRHGPFPLLVYALTLMFGRPGLFLYNLPLFLLVPALVQLLRRPARHLALNALLVWCVASWLLYAVLSNNYGGVCCSVRWFVPFLAPAYWALAAALRAQPRYRPVFLALSVCGAALGAICWLKGPWMRCPATLLWAIVAVALISSLTVWLRSARREQRGDENVEQPHDGISEDRGQPARAA